MKLEDFGWNEDFAKSFEPYAAKGDEVGRVFLQHNKIYMLYTEAGEVWAEATGRLHYHARGAGDLPAVGDWVVIRRTKEEGKAKIHSILPRRSKFSRRAAGSKTEEQIVAANVDTVFIVTALDNDFNLRRLERYLIMAWESGAQPVIVLNKSDLSEEAETRRREVEGIAPDVPVVLMSAKHGSEGVAQMTAFIGAGQTVALLGSSGVGKSTIVNRLLGADAQRTQAVREGDSRGKHTTTHRELFVLSTGGLVIDTPGMRELQLLVSERGLRETFDDIEEIASRCRYSDCRHENERDCAIRDALADATLDAERYASFQKLQGEMRHTAIRQDARTAQEEKTRVKRLTRAFNKFDKRREH